MVDPTDALVSFQEAFKRGIIDVRPGTLDRKLFVHADRPAPGMSRMSYVRLQGKTVTAFANFSSAGFIEALPCFQAGVAVPEAQRGRGRAKDVVRAAIEEMKHGFAGAGIRGFYIEAIVHIENIASQHVAAATISATPVPVTDEHSRDSALQYLMKVVEQFSGHDRTR